MGQGVWQRHYGGSCLSLTHSPGVEAQQSPNGAQDVITSLEDSCVFKHVVVGTNKIFKKEIEASWKGKLGKIIIFRKDRLIVKKKVTKDEYYFVCDSDVAGSVQYCRYYQLPLLRKLTFKVWKRLGNQGLKTKFNLNNLNCKANCGVTTHLGGNFYV